VAAATAQRARARAGAAVRGLRRQHDLRAPRPSPHLPTAPRARSRPKVWEEFLAPGSPGVSPLTKGQFKGYAALVDAVPHFDSYIVEARGDPANFTQLFHEKLIAYAGFDSGVVRGRTRRRVCRPRPAAAGAAASAARACCRSSLRALRLPTAAPAPRQAFVGGSLGAIADAHAGGRELTKAGIAEAMKARDTELETSYKAVIDAARWVGGGGGGVGGGGACH
jgi:hypothetical protein